MNLTIQIAVNVKLLFSTRKSLIKFDFRKNLKDITMSLSPFLRSPFTDLTGGIHSHQMLGRCQKQEGRFMECLEAYGLERGKVKCAHLFEDFHECQTSMKQYKRFVMLGRCARQEMALMDCLEAYGLDRGLVKCNYLVDDFRECHTNAKQFKRFYAMRRERDRQIAMKKRTGDKMYCSPLVDSY